MSNSIIHKEDEVNFLRALNKKGFLLEDKTWKLLEESVFYDLTRNRVIEYNDKRVEIDIILETKKKIYIIECKRTDYNWFFPKAIERKDTLNLIFDSNEGVKVKTRLTNDFKTTWFDIAVKFKENGLLDLVSRGEVRTSYEDIHNKIRQVLKETEAYIFDKRFIDKIIIPIIVTNTNLFQVDYSKANLNSRGDLVTLPSIRTITSIVYNFPEIMRWDKGKQVIKNLNTYQDHVKSIFIVNVNHLVNLIKKIEDQDLGSVIVN